MITLSWDVYNKLNTGINHAADCVKLTAGPRGKNVAYDPVIDVPYIVGNGKEIVKHVKFDDKTENIGAELVRQAMDKSFWTAGDGSVVTAILLQAMWNEGLRNITAGADAMAIMRGIQKAGRAAIEILKQMADPVRKDEEIEGLAKSAGGGRDDIAAIVQDVYKKIGPDGYVTIEDSQMAETIINCFSGVHWDKGYSGYPDGTLVFEKPMVLLINAVVDDFRIMLPVLQYARENNRPVLVIAREMKEDVRNALLYAHYKGGVKVAGVDAPGHGEVRDLNMKYFGIMFNAKLYDEIILAGEAITPEGCGSVEKANITPKDTTLQGIPNQNDPMVLQRKDELKEQLYEIKNEDERYRIEQMLTLISGNSAEILVGGIMEMEMFERKYLTENAIRSTYNAFKYGMLPGGGKAYMLAIPAVRECAKALPGGEALGAEILAKALTMPAFEIAVNAGLNGSNCVDAALKAEEKYQGINIVTEKCEDLLKAGILDSAKTVETAIETAVSTVSLALSINASIT